MLNPWSIVLARTRVQGAPRWGAMRQVPIKQKGRKDKEMKTRSAVAILLLAIFAFSTIAITPIGHVRASGGSSSTLTLPDAELMLSEFAKQWGPGTLTAKVDVAEPGVQFDFTGLVTTDGTSVGDNFAVNALAGGAYKDYGYGFAGYYDFSGYKRYSLVIENVGTESVDVCLFINTGWTVDWSGGLWTGPDGFGASLARDTYWQSGYVSIGPSESKAVSLDFSKATVYNAGDDPVVAWQHPDGTSGVAVQRLDEVSNIGFQVLGDGAGSIVAKGTQLYAEYCKTFEVSVYATHICANLKDYDFSILYNSELLGFVDVDAWGVLGGTSDQADVDNSVPGEIHIWDTGGLTWKGDKGLLFTLTFHVEFDDRATHIWRTTTQPNILVGEISLHDATLSFEEGTIPLSGITVIGSPITVTIHLIRGDLNCDGTVSLVDLRTIAYYYDVEHGDPEWAEASKYDVNSDNVIDLYDLVIVAGNYGYPY